MAKLTPRQKRDRQLGWLARHCGITEDPPGSNRDDRRDGITAAQRALGVWLVGLAWCGTWVAAGLRAGGYNLGRQPWRLASVGFIEDDARAGRRPWRCWVEPHAARAFKRANGRRGGLRGAAVVLFGRGVHVETVRRVSFLLGLVWTYGGNTGSDDAGSQSNGGGAFGRVRRLRDVHGFAIPDPS